MSEPRALPSSPPIAALAALLILLPSPACGPSPEGPRRATPDDGRTADGSTPDSGVDAAAEPAAGAAASGDAATPRPNTPPRPLVAGHDLSAEIAVGAVHVYEVVMDAGRFAAVEVAQDGADVEVRLLRPDGFLLAKADSHTGTYGIEHLFWISDETGAHRVEVHLLDVERTAPGRYAIRLTTPPRPARPADRLRVRAARLYEAGLTDHLKEGRPALAAAAYASAADRFARAGEPLPRAAALYSLGSVRSTDLGDPEAALEPLRRAFELYRDNGRLTEAGIATTSLASALEELKRYDDAIAAYRAALSPYEETEDWSRLALVHNNVAALLSLRGESGQALVHYARAADLWGRVGKEAELGIALTNLGNEHERLGDRAVARRRYDQAIGLFERQSRPVDMAWALGERCSLLEEEGRLEEAESCIRRALEIQRAAGDRRGEALSLVVLAGIVKERGDPAAARRNHARALAYFLEGGEDMPAAILRMNLGWLDLDAGRPLSALVRFHRALRVFGEFGSLHRAVSARYGIARAHGDLGRTREALRWTEGALDLVEELRRSPRAPSLRAHYLASRYTIYDFHVELLMRMHGMQPDRGWEVRALLACERARARTLLENLSRLDAGGGPAPVSEDEGSLRELERRLDALETRRTEVLFEAGDDMAHDLAVVSAEIEDLTYEWQRAWARTARPGEVRPVSEIGVIQERVVDEGSLLLSYHLGRDRSFLWLVAPERLEVFTLPPRDRVEQVARRLHEAVRHSRRHTYRRSAENSLAELSDMLLAPVADRLGDTRRLLVAAEGALLYVPFAALPLPRQERPLIADLEVVTLPSASTLAVQRRRLAGRPRPQGTLAVIDDPVFQRDDPRLGRGDGGRQSGGERSAETLERLPYSALEAEAILEQAPPPTFRATRFDANRELVLSGRLAGYRIVHLATHARVRDDDPAGSGLIVLSRFDAAGRRRNGELRSREIYRLHLPADLVTLSACRTALGEEIRGEGLVGLTHGFFTAGAARVLVSLWDVGDRSTAVLMERFYRALFRQGASPAAALRQAQASMWREEEWRAPYHWAGFVLQGEPR